MHSTQIAVTYAARHGLLRLLLEDMPTLWLPLRLGQPQLLAWAPDLIDMLTWAWHLGFNLIFRV